MKDYTPTGILKSSAVGDLRLEGPALDRNDSHKDKLVLGEDAFSRLDQNLGEEDHVCWFK